MQVVDEKEFSTFCQEIDELVDSWLNDINAVAACKIAEGYSDDAHYYALNLYASAAATFLEKVKSLSAKTGGHVTTTIVKKKQ